MTNRVDAAVRVGFTSLLCNGLMFQLYFGLMLEFFSGLMRLFNAGLRLLSNFGSCLQSSICPNDKLRHKIRKNMTVSKFFFINRFFVVNHVAEDPKTCMVRSGLKYKFIANKKLDGRIFAASFDMHSSPFPALVKQIISGRIIITKKHSRPNAGNIEKIKHPGIRPDKISVPGAAIVKTNHHILGSCGYISKDFILLVKKIKTIPGRVGRQEAFHENRI